MRTITIGRASTNNVVLQPQDISSQHARITDLGNGEYKVEDLDSANGVYVNGYRIKSSNVSLDDQVRLSAKHIIDLGVLFGKKQGSVMSQQGDNAVLDNPKSMDYTEEFGRLKKIHDEFYEKLDKMDDVEMRKQTLMRMGFMIIPILLMKYADMTFAGFSIILATLPQLFTNRSKMRKKKQPLMDDFMRRYTCPNKNCNQMLYGRSWIVWHDSGNCPKCNATYNKNKL